MTKLEHPLHVTALALTKEERRLTSQVIATLQKISDQKIFLDWGYSSLYDYCTKALGYSEACAYRWVAAVKLVRELPQVKQKLEDGSLNLTNLTMAQSLISKIEKSGATADGKERPALSTAASLPLRPPSRGRLDSTEKEKILQQVERCTKFEAEVKLQRIAKERGVEVKKPKESIRIWGDEALLQVSISTGTLAKLSKIKNLRSHKNANMSFGELIEDMAAIVLQKIDPEREVSRIKRANTASAANGSSRDGLAAAAGAAKAANPRYISRQLKAKVWTRDQGRCSFESNGRRCESSHLLQVDHIQPVYFGGMATDENLRLLCHAHHRLRHA